MKHKKKDCHLKTIKEHHFIIVFGGLWKRNHILNCFQRISFLIAKRLACCKCYHLSVYKRAVPPPTAPWERNYLSDCPKWQVNCSPARSRNYCSSCKLDRLSGTEFLHYALYGVIGHVHDKSAFLLAIRIFLLLTYNRKRCNSLVFKV